MKKVLMILLTTMILFTATIMSSATDSDRFDFDKTTGTITKAYVDYFKAVSIPSSIDGLEVKVIGTKSFFESHSLRDITIPNTVTSIESFAFNVWDLTVEIPESVTYIHPDAFCKYPAITFYGIKGSYAESFANQNSIRFLDISLRPAFIYDEYYGLIVQYIGKGVEVIIPPSINGSPVREISRYAFEYSNVTSITIPDSVTKIEPMAFIHCYELKGIYVDENNQNYSSIDGVLFNKDVTEIIQCPDTMISYNIPNSVTNINGFAFFRCSKLENILIPDSVRIIGELAFSQTGLRAVVVPESVTYIGSNAFINCENLTLYGHAGSCVETYAKLDDIPFISINPLDTTPPIITIGNYSTTPTNQNITVTASTNEGTLNTTSYTFLSNGTFDFRAKDASGNVSIKTVTIKNIDKIAPKITLNGSGSVTLRLFSKYNDAGATAFDNMDSSITSKIITTSNLNLKVPGTYYIKYNVKDSAGNSALEVERTITVKRLFQIF